jgi:hypothetical protein
MAESSRNQSMRLNQNDKKSEMMKKKMQYERPKLVDLNEYIVAAQGDCLIGSAASCLSGTFADNKCGSGTNALSGNCSNGSIPGTCSGGSGR